MATDKTKLTELGTAVGLVFEPSAVWPACLDTLEVPGIDADVWRPVVLPATSVGGPNKELLLRAVANGRAFRQRVLRGRRPDRVEWTGGTRAVWTSDIPRDLTVDGVYFIQAKYDSTCVLNTAPGILFDELLVDDDAGNRVSWFEEVALRDLQSYYRSVIDSMEHDDVPGDVRDVDASHRAELKRVMRARKTVSAREVRAYDELCRTVSIETVRRWRLRLRASTSAQRTQMLFRMLRIAGGPYWLLGTKGHHPVQLRVGDTRSWRERYELKRFEVVDAHAGQPQVNWRAEVADRASGDRHAVEGYCEVRWSHGKLQGNPECKVQVTTPLHELPGYAPMA
jgi:hypothetical protein